jgi:hypothetical protein
MDEAVKANLRRRQVPGPFRQAQRRRAQSPSDLRLDVSGRAGSGALGIDSMPRRNRCEDSA